MRLGLHRVVVDDGDELDVGVGPVGGNVGDLGHVPGADDRDAGLVAAMAGMLAQAARRCHALLRLRRRYSFRDSQWGALATISLPVDSFHSSRSRSA